MSTKCWMLYVMIELHAAKGCVGVAAAQMTMAKKSLVADLERPYWACAI
jgi:peptide deformylase